MTRQHVALIDKTGTISMAALRATAAALTIQANRDLAKFWPVDATITAIDSGATIPNGAMPVSIVANLPPGHEGVHLTDHGAPYTNVEMGDGWQIAASHEVCEMLVDPSLHVTQTAPAITVVDGHIHETDGTFNYLIEVCDPSENPEHGYVIDGVPVSDFYTPHYFDAAVSHGKQYSFTKVLTAPRRVLKGGYLSWHNPALNINQQLDWVNHDSPTIVTVNWVPPGARVSREHIDRQMGTTKRLSATHHDHPLLRRARENRT